MCLLALMLLVNCHKQETQHLQRLTGLEGIWEINSHCRVREGAAWRGESPKLAAAAMAVTTRGLGLALEGGSRGRCGLQGADSPSLRVALLVPGSVAPVAATCKRVQGKREKETQTQASAARARSPTLNPWLWGWDEQGGLSSCPSPFPYPHLGMPEQRAAPKYSAQPGRGCPCLVQIRVIWKGQLPVAGRGAC